MTDDEATRIQRQDHRRLITALHDSLPQTPDPTIAPLDGLPAIDWASMGVNDWQKPKPVQLDVAPQDWPPSAPLPKADVVVLTWTTAEWATDSFMFGTTTNNLDRLGCIVEMDDAVIGMVCQEHDTPFGFVRNVSDPAIKGDLPETLQTAWARYIYEQRGLYTSFNGALATSSVIAGGCESHKM
jgi:hypothetical protein